MPICQADCNKIFVRFLVLFCIIVHSMEELVKKLVQVDTTAEMGELAAAELISDHFGRFGIESRIDRWEKNRANLIAEIGSAGAKAGLLFLCHLDVVPPGEGKWKYSPFDAAATDGKIHGRGSVDMKGSIAAVVTAIEQVVDSKVKLKGNIIFAATAGEETDSCGVKRFMQNYAGNAPKLAGIVIPEPTDFEIVTAHRGMLWLKITTTGKTAHSSTPHLGVNAISSMRMFLDKLENSYVG